jgi:transcriptional regulator with GAF, ATPase, and Fis domain
MSPDVYSLSRELAEIARLVEDDDLETTLRRYIDRVARMVPGCDHVSITVAGTDGPELVAEATGYQLGNGGLDYSRLSGPILEALAHREPRRLTDTRTDRRWPVFSQQLAATGLHSVLALPLAEGTEAPAVLTLFSGRADQFAGTSYDIVLLFALHAGVMFDNAKLYHDSQTLVGHLRTALRTRSTVGQAQGLVMQHNGYAAARAFDALKRASQDHNIKLRDLAKALVDGHEQHDLESRLGKFGLLDPV